MLLFIVFQQWLLNGPLIRNWAQLTKIVTKLKKNNASQSPLNAPNWVELENKIAQAAANEVRILLEKRQQKFKEEEEKRKAKTE